MTIGPGTVLGRYTVDAPLGEGGMGEVFRATDTVLGRPVALKILSQDRLMEIDKEERTVFEARFLREARAAALTKHPNAVVLYDFGTLDGVLFIAMELVEGKLLRSAMADPGVVLTTRVRWLHELASALGAIHDAKLIHRDIKPANLMITHEGVLKVLDFGIARRLRGADLGVTTGSPKDGPRSFRTETGQVVGTPRYMAPEQLLGDRIDARVDQYAWGLVAYELLGGGPASEVGRANARKPLTEITNVPAALSNVIEKSLTTEPAGRFATMAEVASAITPFITAPSAPPQAPTLMTPTPPLPPPLPLPPATSVHSAPTPPRPNTVLRLVIVIAALTLVLVLLAGAGAALFLLRGTDSKGAPPTTNAPTAPTGAPPAGHFVWVDLGTSDVAAATAFYTKLFAWTTRPGTFGSSNVYTAFASGSVVTSGLYKQTAPGVPPLWSAYVSVANVDASLTRAASAGGATIVPAFDVSGLGRVAGVKDPSGIAIGVLQPAAGSPARATPLVCVAGQACFFELWTDVATRESPFYAALFGWSAGAPLNGYAFFTLDGAHVAGEVTAPRTTAHAWSVYFAVDDCDASAKTAIALGGAVVVPATNVAGVGRYAVLRDPQGAVFAIVHPRR